MLLQMRVETQEVIPEFFWIADGRTPWEVMEQGRFIGNPRVDSCSKTLKRELLDKFVRDNYTSENCRQYIGIDWTEEHRINGDSDEVVAAKLAAGKKPRLGLRRRRLPWIVSAPLCEPPYLSKKDFPRLVREAGVEPPTAYALGYAHNNCNGECIKGGHAAWALKLRADREGYLRREAWEERMRQRLGDHSILRDRRGGKLVPLTLRGLRERIERGEAVDEFDFGGCGCALD